MMASNIVSRLLPAGTGSPSIYETIRQHEEESDTSVVEEQAGLALDEENLGQNFQDLDLDESRIDASQVTFQSNAVQISGDESPGRKTMKSTRRTPRPRWMSGTQRLLEIDEDDNEVPASLLIEGGGSPRAQRIANLLPPPDRRVATSPAHGSTTQAPQHRQETQARHSLHWQGRHNVPIARRPLRAVPDLALADPKEKALWRWANVENLDNFLQDVYQYYLGKGFWSMLLQRFLALVSSAFVVGFTMFLTNCIHYRNVPGSNRMHDILVPRCVKNMSTFPTIFLSIATFMWVLKCVQYALDIGRLRNMHDFYLHLLNISEAEVQTITWPELVGRLMALRDANFHTATLKSRQVFGSQSKQRMDAQDIANRLMRKENYLIAMFNKEIFDFTLPIPLLRNRSFYSHVIEWNIQQCVFDFVFGAQGQIRPLFLKDTHRKQLSAALVQRFRFAAVVNVIIAPLIVVYLLVQFFFQYFTEYQKNPAQIGTRQYTPLAEWTFREFNELWHLFQKRINMSYPFANRYINQFPKDKTIQAARFVSFIAGALASVLALMSIVDPELFLGFEITHDRTVLFYLGICGTVWAVARGLLPEDNLVFDPEIALQEVIEFTHYQPAHWNGRLHGDEVRKEFATLYQMKLVIFVEEIFNLIFTPFVLWFSLPSCTDAIVDFFREFTVHVDGLGYVCSFAEFNFKKHGNEARGAPSRGQQQPGAVANKASSLRDEYYTTRDQKLEASYWGFMNDYARNPKTDIRFPYSQSRRRFNPPPTFPGPVSPTLPAEMNTNVGLATGRQDPWDRSRMARASPSRVLGVRETPRTGTAGYNVTSPLTSILLDPHHQPSSSESYPSPTVGNPVRKTMNGQSRNHITRWPRIDGSAVALGATSTAEPVAAESVEGGDLGSSWKLDRAGDDDDTEEDIDALTGDTGGGVLGLIKQIRKARAEGQGGIQGAV